MHPAIDIEKVRAALATQAARSTPPPKLTTAAMDLIVRATEPPARSVRSITTLAPEDASRRHYITGRYGRSSSGFFSSDFHNSH